MQQLPGADVDKAAVVFSLNPLNRMTGVPSYTYTVSLRDQKRIPASIHLREIEVRSASEIEGVLWSEVTTLNYERELGWMRESVAHLRDILFLSMEPQLEYCLLIPGKIHDKLLAELINLRLYHGCVPTHGSGVHVVISTDPNLMADVFWRFGPQHLVGSLCIGTRGGIKSVIGTKSSLELIKQLFRSQNEEQLADAWESRDNDWRYCVRIDPIMHDVGDPTYCIPGSWRGQFESRMHSILETSGYKVYHLPLTERLLYAWLIRGEIAVFVGDEQSQSRHPKDLMG